MRCDKAVKLVKYLEQAFKLKFKYSENRNTTNTVTILKWVYTDPSNMASFLVIRKIIFDYPTGAVACDLQNSLHRTHSLYNVNFERLV